MTRRGWIDRGIRRLDDATLAAHVQRVHVTEDGQTLCGAVTGPGDITREQLRSIRSRPSLCEACDDVIWNLKPRKKRA